MCGLSAANSYPSAELNITSAFSWKGKILSRSPRCTLSQRPMVSAAL
jgi:hypothetical protein